MLQKRKEYESCALICTIRKGGPTHGSIRRTLDALEKMGHRSGTVEGEGDGCGIMIDIPRLLWAKFFRLSGLSPAYADSKRLFISHLFLPHSYRNDAHYWLSYVQRLFSSYGMKILLERRGKTRSQALGRNAKRTEPEFWQIAALVERSGTPKDWDAAIFDLQMKLERETPLQPVSMSRYSVVYKVYGSPTDISLYFPELGDPDCTSRVTIGHCRYSTNTWSTFDRAQPFALLGHNGEINTIEKLRREATLLGVQLPRDGSDSQDLDRVLHHFIVKFGFRLAEAMEIVFPPVADEVKRLPAELAAFYHHIRAAFGPFAQGPAALVTRYADECVFSVDALGLRPLWFGETDREIFFTSERGVFSVDTFVRDPKPLAPGEKIAVRLLDDQSVEVIPYHRLQRLLCELWSRRMKVELPARVFVPHQGSTVLENPSEYDLSNGPIASNSELFDGPSDTDFVTASLSLPTVATENRSFKAHLMAAFGWGNEDLEYIVALADTGNEPIGSLGYDGPLAALAPEGHNLSDYYKEIVAVVTNPSMDRERESEHFNTQTLLGPRPPLDKPLNGEQPPPLLLDTPLLVDATYLEKVGLLSGSQSEGVAREAGTRTLEQVIAFFGPEQVARLPLSYPSEKTAAEVLQELTDLAEEAVRQGKILLLLDDGEAFQDGQLLLDPHLALAAVDQRLRRSFLDNGSSDSVINLRRRCSLILRSGALRNLHDLIFAFSLGADGLVPYLIWDAALSSDKPQPLTTDEWERAARLLNILTALTKGLEKVIATMGTHELRGYGKNFASIGVNQEISQITECPNFYGDRGAGLSFARWDQEIRRRYEEWQKIFCEEKIRPAPLRRDYRFYPSVWKAAGRAAMGETDYRDYEERVKALEEAHPVCLRHLLDIEYPDERSKIIPPEKVDIGVGWHDLPFHICSMSFGSQGETAYRVYAEAAYRLNMLALSGEGGELKDLIGRYPFNRGQQVASGRFGVNAYYCNSSYWLEIKIGQGAKPGEGGHLPGRKVTPKVAAVRYATTGVDLISPNNNHDLYSIEDLAQLISELKTINPKAKVIVKVPVVSNIGVISVGIAKAGADVITLSGFDGGTGAARVHALKYVGLPVEVGIKEAHRALTEAGIRHQVELWADGGMRTATDALKAILLGANRVGYGTLAMVAIGCTICRGCQLDTCHVGIATQIEGVEEARRRGLKKFDPREYEDCVQRLVQLFSAMADELKAMTGRLGYERLQDLVGRSDFLVQARGRDRIDLTDLIKPVPDRKDGLRWQRRLRRPLGYTTRMISQVILDEVDRNGRTIVYEDSRMGASDRAIGTHLSGVITRALIGLPAPRGTTETRSPRLRELERVSLHLSQSIAGNGLAAFNIPQVNIRVEGGAQDGVGKGACGGTVLILKGANHEGERVDGSVGKSFCYGAQRGFFAVQGQADSRACIRLSGVDVVFGGEIEEPIDDSQGLINVAAKAQLKGFAFEYMTAGRAVVLGDPGPWICAGMTGGVVYVKLTPDKGFDEAALHRRIAKSAKVSVLPVNDGDVRSIRELLRAYAEELEKSDQYKEANKVRRLADEADRWFVKIVPVHQQADQTVSTE
ncbi:MAG: glutamate synthase-related protein [Armatimonadetes bacterium]|nr:glutamate synthase-related protein [Armatimonadota bacterium]MDW8122473.1 glutamate synthase-related protein [Armatimonadota bacterium]